MILEKNVTLPQPYLSKKLEIETLRHCLNNSAFVGYEMYLITNGVKRKYDFLELDNKNLELSAYVGVEYGFVGEAKGQAWHIKSMTTLLKKKPIFTVFCELSVKGQYNNYLYKSKFRTIREKSVYNLIQQTKDEIKEILIQHGETY
jgi:hypothetical protein